MRSVSMIRSSQNDAGDCPAQSSLVHTLAYSFATRCNISPCSECTFGRGALFRFSEQLRQNWQMRTQGWRTFGDGQPATSEHGCVKPRQRAGAFSLWRKLCWNAFADPKNAILRLRLLFADLPWSADTTQPAILLERWACRNDGLFSYSPFMSASLRSCCVAFSGFSRPVFLPKKSRDAPVSGKSNSGRVARSTGQR